MIAGVLDAGVAIGWIRRGHPAQHRIDALFGVCRQGDLSLYISAVNLAEVLIHTKEWSRSTGTDPVALLRASGVRIHHPDDAVARKVARLPCSLADGFAAATAQELGARLHTTDGVLVRQIKKKRISVTEY
jgi:predicted nucleic acid-binding protein